MPFPAHTIADREDIPELFNDGTNNNILQKINASNMIGLLSQLNTISIHAADIFTDILSSTTKTQSRIKTCKHRINNLESRIPKVEESFLRYSPSYFYDNPFGGKEYKRDDNLNGLLFLREDSTKSVNERRENAYPPADLSALDRVNKNNEQCIKSFTDTDFFINEWLKNEKIKREEEKQRRKQNKKKRKKVKRKHQDKIEILYKPTYDEHGNKVERTAERQRDVTQYHLIDDTARDFSSIMKSSKKEKKRQNPKKNIPKPVANHQSAASYGVPINQKPAHVQVMSINLNGPPPNPMQNNNKSGAPTIPPPNPIQSSTSSEQVKYKMGRLADDLPVDDSIVRVPTNAQSPSAIYAEKYQKRDLKNPMDLSKAAAIMTPPPVPVNRPNVPHLAFLGDIKNFGGGLKKTEPVKRSKPQDKRSLLLGALRGGVQLSSVNLRKIAPKVEKKNLIFEAMKQRRIHLKDDSSSEEDESWGSDSE